MKLTPKLQEKFLEYIRSGTPRTDACALCHITTTTFYDWLQRAAEGEEPFFEFLCGVQEAEAAFKDWVKANLIGAAPNAWQKWAWILERRDRRTYGKVTQVEGFEAPPTDDFL